MGNDFKSSENSETDIEEDDRYQLGGFPVLEKGELSVGDFSEVSENVEPRRTKYYCVIMNFAVVDHEYSLEERAEIFVKNPNLEHFGQYTYTNDIQDNGISRENFAATMFDYVRNNAMAQKSIQFCDTYERFALFDMLISDDGHEVEELLKDFPEGKFTFFAFPDEGSRDNQVNMLCGNYDVMREAGTIVESPHLDS